MNNSSSSAPVVNADTSRLYKDVKALADQAPPRCYEYPEGLEKASAYIEERLRSYGYAPSFQEFTAEGRSYRNVIADYGNAEQPLLVIGAHYDVAGPYPGADDNASGVAGMLEIARLLQKHQPDLPFRVQLVSYANEEPPFFATDDMGSAVHARALKADSVPVKGMICLEMIGYYSDTAGSQDYPMGAFHAFYPDKGNFISVVGKMGQNKLVNHVKGAIQKGGDIPVESLVAPRMVPGVDFSDHRNYWDQGFDAVMITNTSFYRNPHYHDASDTPETLDYSRMGEVVKGIYNAIIGFS